MYTKLAQLISCEKHDYKQIEEVMKQIMQKTVVNSAPFFIRFIIDEMKRNSSALKEFMKKSKDGHIYCLYNESFNHHGTNIYKLGKAKNVKKRLAGYTTSYIKPSTIKLKTKKIHNYSLAEQYVFMKLNEYRVSQNREFFNCSLDLIKKVFCDAEKIFQENDCEKLLNSCVEIKNKCSKIMIDQVKVVMNKSKIFNLINSHSRIFTIKTTMFRKQKNTTEPMEFIKEDVEQIMNSKNIGSEYADELCNKADLTKEELFIWKRYIIRNSLGINELPSDLVGHIVSKNMSVSNCLPLFKELVCGEGDLIKKESKGDLKESLANNSDTLKIKYIKDLLKIMNIDIDSDKMYCCYGGQYSEVVSKEIQEWWSNNGKKLRQIFGGASRIRKGKFEAKSSELTTELLMDLIRRLINGTIKFSVMNYQNGRIDVAMEKGSKKTVHIHFFYFSSYKSPPATIIYPKFIINEQREKKSIDRQIAKIDFKTKPKSFMEAINNFGYSAMYELLFSYLLNHYSNIPKIVITFLKGHDYPIMSKWTDKRNFTQHIENLGVPMFDCQLYNEYPDPESIKDENDCTCFDAFESMELVECEDHS